MISVQTKRHPVNFYLTVILGSLIYLGMVMGMYFQYKAAYTKERLHGRNELLPFFIILVVFLAIYSTFQYFKNAPVIEVSSDKIIIGHTEFLWTDVESIEFTGKRPFRYLTSFPMEAMTLHFKDGQTKYVFDSMYSNTWEIKIFITNLISDYDRKAIELSSIPVRNDEIENEMFDTFSDSQIFSFRGIGLWFTVVYSTYELVVHKMPSFTGYYIIVGILVMLFLVFSWHMNYFKVSIKTLIIKNQNFFWKNKTYSLADIYEVVIEYRRHAPYTLRVITKDYNSKVYPASSLWDKTWLRLKRKLEENGISVRNESF